MANEITITGSLAYANPAKNIAQEQLNVTGLPLTITGVNFEAALMTVPTTAGGTAIPVGNLANLGYAIFKNNDLTNYIELMNAVSGVKICKLFPGEVALFRFGSGVTAPAAIANTASCSLQYLILEN